MTYVLEIKSNSLKKFKKYRGSCSLESCAQLPRSIINVDDVCFSLNEREIENISTVHLQRMLLLLYEDDYSN
jgi:hypothetical protein